MAKFDYLIIGGGIAGTTAAETIRKQDTNASIAIVSEEPHRLYSRILLSKPNFFLEKIPFERVWLKKETWYDENKIDLMTGLTAVALDPDKKVIILDDETKLEYDKLLIATGTCARTWSGPGGDKEGIYEVKTLEDGKGIIQAIKTARTAVTIGGGFISFEMADLLHEVGLDVTMILREKHYWNPVLDATAGKMVEDALIKAGIKVIYNNEVVEVIGDEKITGVKLKDGKELPAELMISGIGSVSSYGWLVKAGIEVNRGILANKYLETNLPDVWVAGDIAEYEDVILDEQIRLGNWVNAQAQGKTAALNMMGAKNEYRFVSFYTTQGLGITVAFVGDPFPKENRIIISRGSYESGKYGQILIQDDEIVGAVLINRTNELRSFTQLVERDIKVDQVHDKLADPDFDLTSLL